MDPRDAPIPDEPPGRPADAPAYRSGVCAIVGRPNVGKSTLLNAIIGQKIAITTPVPQTTRHAIRGILTSDSSQVVFVDTPGMHKPKTLLGSRLNDVAQAVLQGVDLIVLVTDGAKGVGKGDAYLAEQFAESGVPMVGVLNKVDKLGRDAQLPALAALSELAVFEEVVPISARKGEQVELLTDLIVQRMPEGPPLYPVDMVTDSEDAARVAELIRERAMVAMREEVPHSIAVVVEEMGPGRSPGILTIYANIYVERDSQKGMVIGHQGKILAQIGRQARPEIEQALGTKVYLDLRVKLAKDWQRSPRELDKLGY